MSRLSLIQRLAFAFAVLLFPAYDGAHAQVSVNITPTTGNFSTSTVAVTIELCSTAAPINAMAFRLSVDGSSPNDETQEFTYAGGVSWCSGYGYKYTRNQWINEATGSETTLSVDAWDSLDNYGNGAETYTYTGGEFQRADGSNANAVTRSYLSRRARFTSCNATSWSRGQVRSGSRCLSVTTTGAR